MFFEPLRLSTRRFWSATPWQRVIPFGLAAEIIDECFLSQTVQWKGPRHYANDRDHCWW
jgi:hypothetical protein